MDEGKKDLYRQLVKLGDMMGDGLHYEPGGRWISKDYKRIAKALGIDMPEVKRPVNPAREAKTDAINARMAERLKEVKCPKCSGELTQVRSGSMKADCPQCQIRLTLLYAKKTNQG